MPFTKEQQREHYLKNQEILKNKRRIRYLKSKNQVEQKLFEQNVLPNKFEVEQNEFSKVEQNINLPIVQPQKENKIVQPINEVEHLKVEQKKVSHGKPKVEQNPQITYNSDGSIKSKTWAFKNIDKMIEWIESW